MARIYIETYGCTLNQADSDIIMALLSEGNTFVEEESGSDIVIINTCTVKGATENKIMARMKALQAAGRRLVICGCLSANEKRIRRIIPDAPIVSPSAVVHIREALADALEGRKGMAYRSEEGKDGLPKLLGSPIARIPINEGCTSACFFCQTRLARPRLRSYTPKTIVGWMNSAIRGGAREIQLTSMDSGAYGLDIKTDLAALLGLIAMDDSSSRIEGGGFMVRLGMINPDHARRLLPSIISALKHERFYKFLHVPVQSGSDKVCREMNRFHSVGDFENIVGALRKEIPDATISTDIIVGYPTETESDFQETLSLLKRVKPDITNVSKFSPRPGTKAKEMRQLPNETIKRRSVICSRLVREISREARIRFIGRRERVLITEKQRDHTGRDVNYRQVVVKRFKGVLGDTLDVRITDANHGSLFGEPIDGHTEVV